MLFLPKNKCQMIVLKISDVPIQIRLRFGTVVDKYGFKAKFCLPFNTAQILYLDSEYFFLHKTKL